MNPLNERAQYLLKTLIQRYLEDGAPVGSRVLAKNSGLSLSPATVRNVMADLEELDLVGAPHTSAGRVPTAKGYRFYIESLMTMQPLDESLMAALEIPLDQSVSWSDVVQQASQALSGMTQMVGVVSAPRRDHVTLRQIEFLPLSDQRVLAIMVMQNGDVENRVVPVDQQYSAEQLERFGCQLTEAFCGKELVAVKRSLVTDMEHARQRMDDCMQSMIRMADEVIQPKNDPDAVLVSGQTNLMAFGELGDVGQLQGLFDMFSNKRELLGLLERCLQAEGVQIYIGQESGVQRMDQCSAVLANYKVNDEVLGVVGVIGPSRMNYDKVISVVDVTSRMMGLALGDARRFGGGD